MLKPPETLDPTRGPGYAHHMGNDAERADQRGDLDPHPIVILPCEVVMSLRASDLGAVVGWCRETWPDLEDRAWGWDFARQPYGTRGAWQARATDFPWARVGYRFWFDRPDDATWFSMVWG